MKKRLSKVFIGLIVLALGAFGFAGCAKSGVGGDDGYVPSGLDGIIVGTPTISSPVESIGGLIVSWSTPVGAQRYDFTCGDFHTVIEGKTRINLMTESDYALEAGKDIHIKVVAKATNRPDSAPAELTYTVKGVELNSPTNVSLKDGKIKWEGNTPDDKFLVKVDGATVSDGTGDGYWHSTELDIGDFIGSVEIEISAAGDDKFLMSSAPVSCVVNASHSRLVMPQVKNFKIENNILSWDAVGGADGYRVIDLDYNESTVTEPFIDLSDRNLVRGVYALSSQTDIEHGEKVEADMPYLTGKGTATDPYIISTPFELRAIDYYEAKYGEARSAGKPVTTNNYKIANDLDYDAVVALEDSSNIYTLAKPFYGTLDGNGKTFKGVRVRYDGGYWSLFDYLVQGSTVKSIIFDEPDIKNVLQMPERPIGAKIATVANRNYGTISGITVKDARYSASGGEVSGICSHNYGTISGCIVSGTFKQVDTEYKSQACYEMAGVVLENCKGGVVDGNTVTSLTIQGDQSMGDGPYNNVRTAAGICSVNRAGGVVSNNSYTTVNMISMLDSYRDTTDDYGNTYSGYEFGGIVAYNAGTVTVGSGNIGTFTWSATTSVGASITRTIGSSSDWRGKQVGKNDGTVN